MDCIKMTALAVCICACAGTEPIHVEPGGYEPASTFDADVCEGIAQAPVMTSFLIQRWVENECWRLDDELAADGGEQ